MIKAPFKINFTFPEPKKASENPLPEPAYIPKSILRKRVNDAKKFIKDRSELDAFWDDALEAKPLISGRAFK